MWIRIRDFTETIPSTTKGEAMISLPDFSKSFDYENGFYLSCASSRIGKSLAHYELFKMALRVPGVIVECGVFKGASLSRFAMFRDLLCSPRDKRRMVAFDTFGKFPETNFRNDKKLRKHFVDIAGEQSISVSQMRRILKRRGLSDKVDLVAGDIVKTLPAYIKKNRHLKIAVLNLDTDIYEPAVAILEHLYPRICKVSEWDTGGCACPQFTTSI